MDQWNREDSCFSIYTRCISASSSAHPSLGVPKDTELETAMEAEAVTELVPSRPWGKCGKGRDHERQGAEDRVVGMARCRVVLGFQTLVCDFQLLVGAWSP